MTVSESLTAPRAALTRATIVDATRTLIMQENLEAVSLRRVAGSLGVTAPALYAHVIDKRDLMRAVAEDEFTRLIERFERIDDPDPIVRIRTSSRAYIDHALEQPELFKTMFLFPPDLGIATTTGHELPSATRAFELSLVAVAEAIRSGVFRDIEPTMAGLTMWTAIHGCASVLLLGLALDHAGSEALIESVIDTMIAGFLAPRTSTP